MNGLKTYAVCAVYLLAQVFIAMGWLPDPATTPGLDATGAWIVDLLKNPGVTAGVFAVMRWWTERTTVQAARRGLR